VLKHTDGTNNGMRSTIISSMGDYCIKFDIARIQSGRYSVTQSTQHKITSHTRAIALIFVSRHILCMLRIRLYEQALAFVYMSLSLVLECPPKHQKPQYLAMAHHFSRPRRSPRV
jgi:hypothetical protein